MFSWMKTLVMLSSLGLFYSCQNLVRNPSQDTTQDTTQDTNRPVVLLPAPERDLTTHDRLVDYVPYKFEVLFTDPVCGIYKYKADANVKSQSGKVLTQKPENVYCKNKYDLNRSATRSISPQYRLIEWINDANTKEIFFTYLSFTNKAVKNALCEAGKRGVKIRFVMSSKENRTIADELLACSPENIQMKGRGLEGDLGYAHNKFFIINPNTDGEFKISFSSGNMSSGPVIHHENWNFITTHVMSYFAQAHLCAMKAEWDDNVGRTRKTYMEAIQSCRAAIKAPEEKDIKVFFIPGEGEKEVGVTKKTASDYMLEGDGEFPGINTAKKIWLACHRFFYNKMISGFKQRMMSDSKPELRLVADDDTFYKANDPSFQGGDTMPQEWFSIADLVKSGAQAKLMETNSDEHQLHHSKYLIFADDNGFKSLFTGSANLTGAGFKTNWENSYFITIPEVVNRFSEHYEYMWTKLATDIADLPKKGSVGPFLEDAPVINTTNSNNDGEKK